MLSRPQQYARAVKLLKSAAEALQESCYSSESPQFVAGRIVILTVVDRPLPPRFTFITQPSGEARKRLAEYGITPPDPTPEQLLDAAEYLNQPLDEVNALRQEAAGEAAERMKRYVDPEGIDARLAAYNIQDVMATLELQRTLPTPAPRPLAALLHDLRSDVEWWVTEEGYTPFRAWCIASWVMAGYIFREWVCRQRGHVDEVTGYDDDHGTEDRKCTRCGRHVSIWMW